MNFILKYELTSSVSPMLVFYSIFNHHIISYQVQLCRLKAFLLSKLLLGIKLFEGVFKSENLDNLACV